MTGVEPARGPGFLRRLGSWVLWAAPALWGCLGGTVVTVGEATAVSEAGGAGGEGGAAGQAGQGGACEGLLDANPCAACVETRCCGALLACSEEQRCVACENGSTSALCSTNKSFLGLHQCIDASCGDLCKETPKKPCNPVTNEGCSGGESCDLGPSGFECYPPPNDAGICQPCGPSVGAFCSGGLACIDGVCMKFCCTTADCGAGVCDQKALASTTLGVCLLEPMEGEVAPLYPICEVPAVPPSLGACVAFGEGAPRPDCKALALGVSLGSCVPASLGCDPVTSGGCAIGSSCDKSTTGYLCFPPPNTEALCDACDNDNGLFCSPGSTCVSGRCARYCCEDGDCSAEGFCTSRDEYGIGVCMEKQGNGGAGGAGGGGAGSGGAGQGGAP